MSEATLFIFPHAGGAPAYYAPFAQRFSPAVTRVAVPYPGRGGTHDVAGLSSIEALADRLWRKLSPERVGDGAVAFFGHSMGGLVAFEMARRFAAAGRPVDALFVSACAAPGHSGFGDLADSDDALLAAAADMTGIDARALANEEFAARILPTLRGFHAITRYRVPEDALLACPIRAYGGSDDRIANENNIQPWASRTTNDFQLRIFDGHHFYLEDHGAEVAADVEHCLAVSRPPAAGAI
ncbi:MULTISPECIES: thioesterase II family protein [Tsukamurella]|uniref:Thioesterase TesA n=2 Tax=Tsukamurella TaxID=2060 RepID=A0A5C5S808_9ACTN|nr:MULTISPECIES: alpha/beta fold hydrolase [Tsukamurella]NMD55261.1 thioesterase [Tsukamurella columbiensis]TWS30768.1 thioesterase [Tsukamurella conjunctivitidis]